MEFVKKLFLPKLEHIRLPTTYLTKRKGFVIVIKNFMKKGIFLLLVIISSNIYAFWIWSPKTQKWKNPQYSSLALPQLQFKKAFQFFENGKYKTALQEFRKILIHFPDAQEAAEACYYIGRCWEKLNRFYQAFLSYDKLVVTYPNSKRIQEALEREYRIGEYFLNQKPKKWLGISIYDLVEHPSLEIFRRIAERAPYSKYAPASLYKMGMILVELKRWEEAKDTFQKIVDNYPDSKWFKLAKFQLSLVCSKLSLGSDYDDTYYQEAKKGFEEFLKNNPEAKISKEAKKILEEIKEKEAKKYFDIAQFYKKQKKFKSAIIYYELLVRKYPESKYAQEAEKILRKLKK